MSNLHQVPSYPWQGLGWLVDPWSTDAQGSLPARYAIGHTGWTGTSIWADRESGVFGILLGNTCHPTRRGRNNRRFRQSFYEVVSTTFFANKCAAHSGLDRVLRDSFEPLGEQRTGLLTNSAAVDMIKRPILDVMDLDPQRRLSALFSPEHGLLGQAEAGEKVGDRRFGSMPVVSLYGNRTAPTREELAGIDLFVVDLPDVGARYYTYMATMKHCLEACAAANKPVLVLDRPNPLGGVILEGPIAERTGSMVCCAPLPVRHGMTLGELALFFAESMSPKPRIDVLPVEGWPRRLQFEQCSLPWVAPSPNMPYVETARVYIGTCLFEGTNLNEGRGTDRPFQLIGAPWLDGKRVIEAMSEDAKRGFKISPTFYKPEAIPGKASNPRFKDQTCGGVYIDVADADACRPFYMALEMIAAIRRTHGLHFEFTDFFDTLAGGSTVRQQLESGADPRDMVAGWSAELDAFARKRPRLYS